MRASFIFHIEAHRVDCFFQDTISFLWQMLIGRSIKSRTEFACSWICMNATIANPVGSWINATGSRRDKGMKCSHRRQIAAIFGGRTVLCRIWSIADHATALSTTHHCDPHHRAQQLNNPARLEPDGANPIWSGGEFFNRRQAYLAASRWLIDCPGILK